MENIRINLKDGVITVILPRKEDTDLDAMREASKILQREVLRRENDYRSRFYW